MGAGSTASPQAESTAGSTAGAPVAIGAKPAATQFHKAPTQTVPTTAAEVSALTAMMDEETAKAKQNAAIVATPSSVQPVGRGTGPLDATRPAPSIAAAPTVQIGTGRPIATGGSGEEILAGFEELGPAFAEDVKSADGEDGFSEQGSERKPHFPLTQIWQFAGHSFDHVVHGPVKVKLRAATILLLVVAAIVVLAVWGFSHRSTSAYIAMRQPLLSGPGGAGYSIVAQLERGEQVTIVSVVGDYAMVRDTMGRGGYVAHAGLSSEPPPALPTEPFASCRQSPLEATIASCRERAQTQLASCRKSCQQDGGAAANMCADHCQQRFVDCLAGCETKLEAHPKAVPVPPPAPGDAAAAGVPADDQAGAKGHLGAKKKAPAKKATKKKAKGKK